MTLDAAEKIDEEIELLTDLRDAYISKIHAASPMILFFLILLVVLCSTINYLIESSVFIIITTITLFLPAIVASVNNIHNSSKIKRKLYDVKRRIKSLEAKRQGILQEKPAKKVNSIEHKWAERGANPLK